MKKFIFSGFAIFAAALISITSVDAWDWMKPFKSPKRDVRTLIVSGNYTKHRILAELIQLETRQPILLLPATPGGKIFFMPYQQNALEIEDAKFTNFVKFTNPERILVIHDGGPITQSFIERIDQFQTKVIVHNKNMEMTAIEIGKILDITDLADDFAKINRDIDSGKFYRAGSPVSNPEPAANIPAGTQSTIALPPAASATAPIFIQDTEVVPK